MNKDTLPQAPNILKKNSEKDIAGSGVRNICSNLSIQGHRQYYKQLHLNKVGTLDDVDKNDPPKKKLCFFFLRKSFFKRMDLGWA